MVNGVLKSRPPTSRKPQGEGPFSVTVWGMFGVFTARGKQTDDSQIQRGNVRGSSILLLRRGNVNYPESSA